MPGKKLTDKDLETFAGQLRLMLSVVNGDIDKLEAEALQSNGQPNEDGESYFKEFSLELLERDESTMQEILDALDRIQAGGFGKCCACGAWIRKDRLRAVPHARNCIDCQRAKESAS